VNVVTAGKYIANINFYTAKDGEQEDFYPRDTVTLKAWKTIAGTFNVEYTFIYPDGRRLGPRTYTLVGTGEFVIDRCIIAENDPVGTYQIKIRVFDLIGNMVGDDYLIFYVKERSILELILKPEILAAITIVAIAAIIGGVLVIRRPKEVVTPPVIEAAKPPSAGETVLVKAPGTLLMRKPSGETMTYIAGFRVGERMIPITSLPQTFGREDFRGIVPEEALNFISRSHFIVRYDYSRGHFIIEDLGSTNGTLLNGEEIKGKGAHELKDGDVISPAGAVNLRFNVKVA
jgi:hypothetical protein